MKKEYTKPELVKHGKLEEQTQGGVTIPSAGDFGSS